MRIRRLWIILAVLLVVSVTVTAVLVLGPGTVRASKEGEVSVYLGDPDYAGPVAKLWYVTSRHSLAREMAATRSTIEALVVFRRYLSPEEASSVLVPCTAIEAFLADPDSYAGGGVVLKPQETLSSAARRYAEDFAAIAGDSEDMKADVARALAGMHLVLAVRVSAPAEGLMSLISHQDVLLVDPLYHPEAEGLAASRGTEVHYRCVPVRPDGRPF